MTETSFESIDFETSGAIATIFLNRPPSNFFDFAMIKEIGAALRQADDNDDVRVVILAARGRVFCAGANFNPSGGGTVADLDFVPGMIYVAGLDLLRTRKPIIAALQGSAIGGGLGLACVADFRVTCPEASLSANFCRIGFHPGFGLTAFLPRLIGHQTATRIMYTGERIPGTQAVSMGLADVLAPDAGSVLGAATDLANEIAASGPLAVMATRETMRSDMIALYEAATKREGAQQDRLRGTFDFGEGVAAYAERRLPQFRGA